MKIALATVAFLLLMSLQPAFAGYVLSVEDAESLLAQNSIELKAEKEDLKKSDADVVGARLLPNPEVKYFLATDGSGPNNKESTYSVIQPMDLAGKRGKRIETTEKRRDAGRLFFDYKVLALRSQMKQAYYRILLLQANERAVAGIVETSHEVERKTTSRVDSGDASEVELMRIGSERKKLARLLDNLTIEIGVERKRLALMLNLSDPDFVLVDEFRYQPLPGNVKDIAEGALESRVDVRAQAKVVDAAGSSLSLAKREAIPSVGIEAGYRRWVGGSDGFVLGLAIPLPLFDRGQGKIASAYAEREKQRLNYELLKKYAGNEIGVLLSRITHYQGRIADMAGQLHTAKEMTKISRTAYEEGETNLLELLDSVRSEKDLVMEYNSAVYEYWASVFELERATGSRLTNGGGKP
ncbi:MAG TPA: TolC family protein [Syntrophorhabdaceae bacterium]